MTEAIRDMCLRARTATRRLALEPRVRKDAWLERLAFELGAARDAIVRANDADVARARAAGVKDALVDRLATDDARLEAIARGVRDVAKLHDPVGDVVEERARPNKLRVRRVRVPLGVIGMVYEARPNVTIEAAALAIKAGNAIILRGGTDAQQTNAALMAAIARSLEGAGLPKDSAQALEPSRDAIRVLAQQEGLVDLLIPRGGEALVRFVAEHARVPVVQHFKGVCHLYVDEGASLEEARAIVLDAKLARPGTCNALECLLVHAAEEERLLAPIRRALEERGCAIRTGEDAYGVEFLDRVLAVRVVRGLDEAIEHVARYGSGHTEAIVTPNERHAERWRREVDAACVVVNASTRFHDGGELGLGAEIGIATSRLHWRGPMGLEALTTMKWIVEGEGQIRG